MKEARLIQSLNHPCIPSVYDVEEDESYYYVISRYIEGESIGALCEHRLLSEKEVFLYFSKICSVIEYLHSLPEKVMHLDIKPENVLISEDNVWLIDFGSAIRPADGERKAHSISPGFTAPEQKTGDPVDCCTDVYALGRLLEFMTGHSTVNVRTAAHLKKIAGRCCAAQPWRRIASVDILIKMLGNLRDTEAVKGNKRSPNKRPEVKRIGVLGLARGTGTTHIALTLANCLADFFYKEVCLTEISDRNDLGRMLDLLYADAGVRTGEVRINGVTYSETGLRKSNASGAGRDFDCIIYDLGSNRRKAAEILRTCDLRIAVAGAAVWRTAEYDFLNDPELAQVCDGKWIILVNLADEVGMSRIKSTGIPMLPFPYEPTPLQPHRKSARICEEVMG